MKKEIGYWESDTMIGKGHKGVVVTHVDKASKFLLGKDKTMPGVNRVTMKLFQDVPAEYRQTMTFNHRPRKSLNYQTPFEVFYAKSESVVKQI